MELKKGRGAQRSVQNKFEKHIREREYSDNDIEELNENKKTKYIEVYPKTIVNKIDSPDLSLMYSMNPYQGCEHGCVYCYARNSHEYWGYGAGFDFEQNILIKRNAAELLAQHLRNPGWVAHPIALSGNTDCYQPIERKEKITREILKTFWKYRHPVSIITKNALISRDEDILQDLASKQLVHVTISITSLKEEIRRKLEPRTASVKQKLKVIEHFSSQNIPVQLMMGPIIPGLTNYEIFEVAKAAANAGARGMVFTVVHLNGHLGKLFTDWIYKAFPDKAKHVLSLIKQVHGGQLNDSRWGIRKRGEGQIAKMMHRQIGLAREKYFRNRSMGGYDLELHKYYKDDQLNLFFNRTD